MSLMSFSRERCASNAEIGFREVFAAAKNTRMSGWSDRF
ncbi:hypothetical protein PS943_00692 [Pseudomonas fluorescens]|jgi:hypothetical protein|uniref:Uncharacterized protein n=1 Tax=Pseudomonas fluorescens TaxID=294 RepID=A0A5E7VZP6_PSEFL|nr:hypothetical protein PS943_00692 [Pseudomonas fluorescens]